MRQYCQGFVTTLCRCFCNTHYFHYELNIMPMCFLFRPWENREIVFGRCSEFCEMWICANYDLPGIYSHRILPLSNCCLWAELLCLSFLFYGLAIKSVRSTTELFKPCRTVARKWFDCISLQESLLLNQGKMKGIVPTLNDILW